MPRIPAVQRLEIMSKSIAYAEDRRALGAVSVPVEEIAAHLGESAADVRESLDPLRWVEMPVPGGFIDLLDAARVEDDQLFVEDAWWRRLAVLDPAEAARLYTKASVAAALDPNASIHLSTAMAKLRRIVGEITVTEGDAPHNATKLAAARSAGQHVLVNLEGHDRTLITSQARFSVLAVFRQGHVWMATLGSVSGNADLGMAGGEAVTVPVERLLAVSPVSATADFGESAPSVVDPEPVVDVTVEYPADRDWVLDAFDASSFGDVGEGRRRATVRIWGAPELKTILLRLGPASEVVAPESHRDLRAEAAREILELYES